MNIRQITAGAALLAALLPASPAAAQVTLSPTPVTLTGAPGGALTFSGTLANTGASTVFINGDTLTFNAPGITADDTPFLTDAPLFLTPGSPVALPTSQYTGPFFTVDIGTGAQSGDYSGTFVVQGGADQNAQGTLATQQFTVDVSAAPEPSQIADLSLVAVGLIGLTWRARKRRAA